MEQNMNTRVVLFLIFNNFNDLATHVPVDKFQA